MINIWLDAINPAPDEFISTKTAISAISVIIHNINKLNTINIISLDSDYKENEQEGYKILSIFEKMKTKHPDFKLPNEIRIHSDKPTARKKMQEIIDNLYNK